MARSTRTHALSVGFALLVACAPAATPPVPAPAPTPVLIPPSASSESTPPLVLAPGPADVELSIGEAIVLEGSPIVGQGNPSSDAIEYRAPVAGKLVVHGRRPGEALFSFSDLAGKKASRTFRIIAEQCRDTPLHPVVVLGIDDRASIDVGPLRDVEALHRDPWIAGAGKGESKVFMNGQQSGHTTIMAAKTDGTVLLWDVFVGGMCAHKRYMSVVAAVPPGNLGPKGDGTCVRRSKVATPAPCPDLSHIDAASNETLSELACGWAAACDRQGDEGCCVGCTNPFRMKIERSCAIRMLRMRTCAEVQRAFNVSGCIK